MEFKKFRNGIQKRKSSTACQVLRYIVIKKLPTIQKHVDILFIVQKNTNNIDLKTKNGRPVLLSKCDICGGKKSRFMKGQETKGLLNNLGLKTPSSKIPILGDVLF